MPAQHPSSTIVAHVDGGSRGNPGPAAYAAVIKASDGSPLASLSKFLGKATNNYAEYQGLLAALRYALEHGFPALEVISDSELLVRQIRGTYKVKSPDLKPLYDEARRMIAQLQSFTIRHVMREENREADRLANAAMDAAAEKPFHHKGTKTPSTLMGPAPSGPHQNDFPTENCPDRVNTTCEAIDDAHGTSPQSQRSTALEDIGARFSAGAAREPIPERLNELARACVDAAYKVHSNLGPGLLESVYEACMVHELKKRGLAVQQQVLLPIRYDDLVIDAALRVDILVEASLVVEVKAVEATLPVHSAQVLTYLKLSGCRLGLLINFNSVLIRDGIRRIIL